MVENVLGHPDVPDLPFVDELFEGFPGRIRILAQLKINLARGLIDRDGP